MDFLGGNLVPPIEAIGNVLDKLTTSDDERNAFTLAMAKLRDHQEELRTEFNKVESQSEIADRASARDRQISLKDHIPEILALTITVGFFGLLIMMMVDDGISAAYKDVMNVMIGSLGTAWLNVIGYYFGGSVGLR